MTKRKRLKIEFVTFVGVALLSVFVLYLSIVLPLCRISQAKDWEPVECLVKSVEFDEKIHQGTDGNFVSKNFVVRYSYEYEGEMFESMQYAFMGIASNHLSSPPPIGLIQTGYVNPEDPRQAVIIRTLPESFSIWFLPFGGMLFLACGIGGSVSALKKIRKRH
ncbi:MAG TPA: DUF3592 domain-containing protein [Phycisphaerales bacterium]|nr:DUF3592 domain-containing protein [Phycisphaerales bacterium]